jgi:hypothetical protein
VVISLPISSYALFARENDSAHVRKLYRAHNQSKNQNESGKKINVDIEATFFFVGMAYFLKLFSGRNDFCLGAETLSKKEKLFGSGVQPFTYQLVFQDTGRRRHFWLYETRREKCNILRVIFIRENKLVPSGLPSQSSDYFLHANPSQY